MQVTNEGDDPLVNTQAPTIDPIFHETIRAMAFGTTATQNREEREIQAAIEDDDRQRAKEEAQKAEAEILQAVNLDLPLEPDQGTISSTSTTSRNNSAGLSRGNRVEVVFGNTWVKGTLEQEINASLGLWNVRFDDGINQTMTLTSDTVGAEWRLESEETQSSAADLADPTATRAREELPELLAMGMRIEAKFRRSARFFPVSMFLYCPSFTRLTVLCVCRIGSDRWCTR